MMTPTEFLRDLAERRQKFLDGVDANRGDIDLDIFTEDFYPDQAHFLFELLQNAEDAQASEVFIDLEHESCKFEHNGARQFDEDDVRGITGINNSKKKESEEQIGKFGIGFKSVFAYSLTPHVYSERFSFKITELVLPEPIDADPQLGQRTRFWLPFDNSQRISAQDAHEEIRTGLESLGQTTLLFLSNLTRVRWRAGVLTAEIRRIAHSEHHFEIRRHVDGGELTSGHFLRFTEPVEGTATQYVAVAYELGMLDNVSKFDPQEALAEQMRVAPAEIGQVAIYFRADKENSGLRFHLHAPFVPELSRAAIRETAVNDPLFGQLASLGAASLHAIRDLGLLDRSFLGVLPNSHDAVTDRYLEIRTRIHAEMLRESLVPAQSGSYAPAERLLQSSASLKRLLSASDMQHILNDEKARGWAVAATQKNTHVDRFLDDLSIPTWDIDDFFQVLRGRTGRNTFTYDTERQEYVDGPETEFMEWMTAKSALWHQQLYALLHDGITRSSPYDEHRLTGQLRTLNIVRMASGEYTTADQAFFPREEDDHDDVLLRVERAVYSSGKHKGEQQRARQFLELIGVREVGEAEEVEGILKSRYCCDVEPPSKKTHYRDMKRFTKLVRNDSEHARLFGDYCVLMGADGRHRKPVELFIDAPYAETGLSAYYRSVGDECDCSALASDYLDSGISTEDLVSFAEAVGVCRSLRIQAASCTDNPDHFDLVSRSPGRWTTYGMDQDWVIKGLDRALACPDLPVSRLVWRTLCEHRGLDWTAARYRNNGAHLTREAPSQVVCVLKEAAWIPQTDEDSVLPRQARRELLPEGFPFDAGEHWLHAIEFGQEHERQQSADDEFERKAQELGFETSDELRRAQDFSRLPTDIQQELLRRHSLGEPVLLPINNPKNPDQRKRKAFKDAGKAPVRENEPRKRSVVLDLPEAKKRARSYLRHQYTCPNGEMVCQACRDVLPFQIKKGQYYFEAVEFLEELNREHRQNYVALCPNHAAMYKHANASKSSLLDKFLALEGDSFRVSLAGNEVEMYFTQTHILDLQAAIGAEMSAPDS